MTSSRPYIARALYEWLVDNDLTPQIVVNAEAEGVEVPRDYVTNGQIVLNIGVSAVGEFSMNNDAIAFSARFGGKATRLMVPMEALVAIYARENGVGMVFGHEPVLPQPEAESGAADEQPDPEAEGAAETTSDSDGEDTGDRSGAKPKGRPALRVVK
ncbi:MAG TPA: ClpXP protease specificity-enhancing factor [Halomonas sp.]|nr:ClpXP protease specificity-enhancing factor [Halomonas sp.]